MATATQPAVGNWAARNASPPCRATRRTGRPSSPRAAPQAASASASEAPALLAEDIRVSFGGDRPDAVHALKGASLRVPRGTLHMLLGPNGCGKSTLLRVCAGMLTPQAGRLRVSAPRAFVFQNPDHQVVMPTVGADVAFGLGRLDLPAKEVTRRVDEALAMVNLQGFGLRPVHTLSGGQRQRVAIAGALAEQPQVLLLDELTTYLDPEDQQGVLDAVRAVVDGPQRVTAVWVTHRLEELDRADGATYLEDGVTARTSSGPAMRAWLEKQAAQCLAEAHKQMETFTGL